MRKKHSLLACLFSTWFSISVRSRQFFYLQLCTISETRGNKIRPNPELKYTTKFWLRPVLVGSGFYFFKCQTTSSLGNFNWFGSVACFCLFFITFCFGAVLAVYLWADAICYKGTLTIRVFPQSWAVNSVSSPKHMVTLSCSKFILPL